MERSAQKNGLTKFSGRLRIAIACLISVALCFVYAATRSSWGNSWYQANGGGVPYTVFWILLIGVFFPDRKSCVRVCIITVIAICGLEFLQMWNPEPLADFRRTKFGAALLGTTFVWHDIPPYFIGGVVGGVVLWILGNRS